MPPEHHVGEEIMSAIKSGDVKMRPRWYFMLRGALAILAITIVILAAVFFISFVVFFLRKTGEWFVPMFGLQGWYAIFTGLPWVLVCLSGIFVVMLAILAQRYPFGYQWPLFYSVLGAFFLVGSMSFLFIRTSFYRTFFDSSIPREIPLLSEYYPDGGLLVPANIRRGQVIAVLPDGFVIQGQLLGDTSTILVASDTVFPDNTVIHPGDVVVIFAKSSSGTIVEAGGIEKITP